MRTRKAAPHRRATPYLEETADRIGVIDKRRIVLVEDKTTPMRKLGASS